jgi:hypothetical protein
MSKVKYITTKLVILVVQLVEGCYVVLISDWTSICHLYLVHNLIIISHLADEIGS